MKKTMKKVLAAMMAVVMVGGLFAACTGGEKDSGDKLKIGVIQFMEHVALDNSYKGFLSALEKAGYSEDKGNLEINFQNAQGEQATCRTIADTLATEKCDLILAIATQAAQAVANVITDTPILVTAVTDLEEAGLLSNGNVTGTSDLNPLAEQMDLLKQLVPNAKNVGLFYTSSEENSRYQVALAKTEIEKLGMGTQEFTITDATEIQSVVESMRGKVDAIYIPTDNKLATGMATVSAAANAIKMPSIVGEGGMVENGGLATYGIDYVQLGEQTGAMAIKILVDKVSIADLPVEYQDKSKLAVSINTDTATALGIEIPEELLNTATVFPAE